MSNKFARLYNIDVNGEEYQLLCSIKIIRKGEILVPGNSEDPPTESKQHLVAVEFRCSTAESNMVTMACIGLRKHLENDSKDDDEDDQLLSKSDFDEMYEMAQKEIIMMTREKAEKILHAMMEDKENPLISAGIVGGVDSGSESTALVGDFMFSDARGSGRASLNNEYVRRAMGPHKQKEADDKKKNKQKQDGDLSSDRTIH